MDEAHRPALLLDLRDTQSLKQKQPSTGSSE